MKSFDKAVIIRVPRIIACGMTRFPPQALGVICNYLRRNNINVQAYDLGDVMGKENAYNLYSRLYYGTTVKRDLIDGESPELDVFFAGLENKIDLNNFPLVLISPEIADYEVSLASILLSKYIKRLNKDAIVIGGDQWDHIDYLAQLKRNNKLDSMDFIVKSHSVESILKILGAIENGLDPSGIPGIIYTDVNNNVIETPVYEKPQILDMLDFDDLNLEYYKLRLSDFLPRKYLSDPGEKMLLVPFTFIFGCPNSCAFCTYSVSKCLKYMSPEDVVRILGQLCRKYGTSYFMFLNNTLNISYGYIDELCDRIAGAGMKITWSDCVNIKNLDKKLLLKMKKAGAAKLYFGLETGSDRMLERCRKGITAKDAEMCLQWSSEAGIWNGVEIIAGLPHEKEDDIDETIDFINSNRHVIDEISVSPFMLHRGSYFFEDPASFDIENIVDQGVELSERIGRNRGLVMDFPTFRYAFDEKNGKRWKDKMTQIVRSYSKITGSSKVNVYPATNVDLQILLYLYGNHNKKEEVRKIYSSFLKRQNIKNVFSGNIFLSLLIHGQYGLCVDRLLRGGALM